MTCRICNTKIKGHERVWLDKEGGAEPHPSVRRQALAPGDGHTMKQGAAFANEAAVFEFGSECVQPPHGRMLRRLRGARAIGDNADSPHDRKGLAAC